MSVKRVSVQVHGRVQGVWFRESTRQEADRLGVAGWTCNEPDGTVRIEAEGPAEAVDALVAWAHEGPPHARVDRVDVREDGPEGFDGFEVRR